MCIINHKFKQIKLLHWDKMWLQKSQIYHLAFYVPPIKTMTPNHPTERATKITPTPVLLPFQLLRQLWASSLGVDKQKGVYIMRNCFHIHFLLWTLKNLGK